MKSVLRFTLFWLAQLIAFVGFRKASASLVAYLLFQSQLVSQKEAAWHPIAQFYDRVAWYAFMDNRRDE